MQLSDRATSLSYGTVVTFTDGVHEAEIRSAANGSRAQTASRDYANLTAFSVYLGAQGDGDAITAIREERRPRRFSTRLGREVGELTDAFSFTEAPWIAQSNYVVGVCTPVEFGEGRLTVDVNAGGVDALPLTITYSTEQLTGDVREESCNAVDPVGPCNNRQCGLGALNSTMCGVCETVGPTSSVCREHQCVCPSGHGLCENACMDFERDENNCGACGQVCATGASCVGGTCQCPIGLGICNGECIPLDTTDNCGACGTQCAQGANCRQGTCACEQGRRVHDRCVDFQSPDNCGGCGTTCDVGVRCGTTGCVNTCERTDCNSASTLGLAPEDVQMEAPVRSHACRHTRSERCCCTWGYRTRCDHRAFDQGTALSEGAVYARIDINRQWQVTEARPQTESGRRVYGFKSHRPRWYERSSRP